MAERINMDVERAVGAYEAAPKRLLPAVGIAQALRRLPDLRAKLRAMGAPPPAAKMPGEALLAALIGPEPPDARAELAEYVYVLTTIEQIIGIANAGDGRLPPKAVTMFNALASRYTFQFVIDAQGTPTTRQVTGPVGGSAVTLLWFLLQSWQRGNLRHLKLCALRECRRWFLDPTRPGNRERCPEHPADKVWNAARRRAAGHAPRRSKRARARR